MDAAHEKPVDDLVLTNNNKADEDEGLFFSYNRHRPLLRCCSLAALIFSLFPFFFFSLSFIADSSFAPPIWLPSQCKIVSTSVDLRSAKVCELGLLNYKAKNVFYPFETPKFRCRYDYYWASIFQVEYKEQSTGQRLHALAEAPKEALPINCRPGFGIAWLTKEKFRVNRTYYCRYTPGLSQVDIYSDSHFNCQAKDPSTTEMIRRYYILLMRIVDSTFSIKGRAKQAILHSIFGVFTGMSSALVFITMVKLLSLPFRKPRNQGERKQLHFGVPWTCMRRTCFLFVYLFIMGYLGIQYLKMVGLRKIFLGF